MASQDEGAIKTKIGPKEEKVMTGHESAEMEREAVILLGHGSRVPDAGKDMQRVVERLKEKYGYDLVEVCFMSRLGPHFPETLEKCVNRGATSVVVVPYFLHEGLHIVLDIPEMLQEEMRRYPQLKLRFGPGFGFDELLVDLVEKRIGETRELCDIRQISLPSKEQFPVPPGQCEFVAMLPEEAEKYRGGDGESLRGGD